MDIAHCLNEIETRIGRLSPMQKFLLGTDGSVTQILEAITGETGRTFETREQKIIPADRCNCRNARDRAGDPVNYRIVETQDAGKR